MHTVVAQHKVVTRSSGRASTRTQPENTPQRGRTCASATTPDSNKSLTQKHTNTAQCIHQHTKHTHTVHKSSTTKSTKSSTTKSTKSTPSTPSTATASHSTHTHTPPTTPKSKHHKHGRSFQLCSFVGKSHAARARKCVCVCSVCVCV